MFLIITKWTPLVPGAKYLNFFALEEIYRSDNQNPDGTPMIDPSRYDRQTYESWVTSVFNYRDLLTLNSTFVYQFLEIDNSDVIYTVQGFPDRAVYDTISTTDTYITHQAQRTTLNQLLQLSAEVKKVDVDVPNNFLSDYQMVESLFDLY